MAKSGRNKSESVVGLNRKVRSGYIGINDRFGAEYAAIKRQWMAEGVETFVSNVTHKVFAQEEAAQALWFLQLANKFAALLRAGEQGGENV